MTHYSTEAGHVQAFFFKPSGKRYTETMLDMTDYWSYGITPEDAVRAALHAQLPNRLLDMIVVVPEPYHERAYPVCLYRGEIPDGKTLFDFGRTPRA